VRDRLKEAGVRFCRIKSLIRFKISSHFQAKKYLQQFAGDIHDKGQNGQAKTVCKLGDLSFPCRKRVAAGKPIEAVEDVDVIEVPPFLVGSGEHFVLLFNP